jgi:septal ring factor EnvC (AmiA/AmiB activator)
MRALVPLRSHRSTAFVAFMFGTVAALSARAADQQSPAPSIQELEAIQQQIDQGKIQAGELNRKAEQLAKDVAKLQRQLIQSAADVQAAEEQATGLEDDLEELTAREAARSAELAQKRGQLSRTLMALERLSLRPSQAAFFSDRPAIDEARAARLLTAATQSLDARARQLQSDLAEIQELHEATTAKQEELAASVRNLAKQNVQLSSLLETKSKLRDATQQQTAEQKRRQGDLASQASDLKDLLDRLALAAAQEAERQRQAEEAAAAAAESETAEEAADAATEETDEEAEPDTVQTAARTPQPDLAAALSTPAPADLRSFPAAEGSLTRPARGDIVAKFGERTEAFGEGKGLVFSTRPGAQIVSPFDGQIVFEGPFRSYGQILIIEHRGGYHTVLAGLSHVAVAVGQWLKAGEPVGAMAEAPDMRPQLYVELRRSGTPFDPAPWLAQ